MPDDAQVHNSAIRRMEVDPHYRPGNLILGGGGRGFVIAPKSAGTGEWIPTEHEGDLVRGIFVRKPRASKEEANSGDASTNGN